MLFVFASHDPQECGVHHTLALANDSWCVSSVPVRKNVKYRFLTAYIILSWTTQRWLKSAVGCHFQRCTPTKKKKKRSLSIISEADFSR